MSSAFTPLPQGTVLDGKWKVESLLGEGGMGAVYRATHVRNSLSVAIKVLHQNLAATAAIRERFLHEGYAANKVGHGGTVRVLDDGQDRQGGHVFLVMELLVGEPIDKLVDARGGKLPYPDVLAILDSTLETLGAAHKAGIVHRDIKPENLFITVDGSIKILDFGLARIKEASSQARLTVTGVPMGTPAFMPAEQALAKWDEVDTRSDVYSIAASVWNMLTGRLVHEGDTVPQLLVAVSTKQASPISTVVPDLPAPIAAVIDKGLAQARDDRWFDAAAMLEALRSAVEASQTKLSRVQDLSRISSRSVARTERALVPRGAPNPAVPFARGAPPSSAPMLGAPPRSGHAPNFDGETTLITDSHAVPGYQPGAPMSADPRSMGMPFRLADPMTSDAGRTQVRTVAPVSTEPPGVRRARKNTEIFVAGVGIVLALSAVAGAAIMFNKRSTPPSASETAAAASTATARPSESAAPLPTSEPDKLVSPAPSESEAASATPAPSSSAAPKTKKHPGAGTGVAKPKSPTQDDVLGTYKRPPKP